MKNVLIRLGVSTPIVGGVLVILLLVAGGSMQTPSPSPSVFLLQSGTNALTTSLTSTNLSLSLPTAGPPKINLTFLVIVVAGLILLGVQTWANYFRQWYDPTLALKYWDWFCDEEETKKRQNACRHYIKHKEWNIDIEDTLDLLDDLGFYVQTLHVSRDVLHQYFYWWIRGYVVLADSYIASKQAGDPKRKEPADPTRWEHCKLLLREVSKVEAKRLRNANATDQRLDWDDEQKMRFLNEEADSEESEAQESPKHPGHPPLS